ncbi:MAG: hypothetical protein HS111_39510 [Kofleriaceae bacterium]|nr:hypothetical protein [Kofleriaceae bacterium]
MKRPLVVMVVASIAAGLAPGSPLSGARAERGGGGGDGVAAEVYSCGKPRGRFAVNLKDEVALRDLVAWAMGFSCKRFVYASSLASRSAKLTMITPGTLDAGEAWAVFEVGLEAMGLTAVPKGGVLELVETAQAKDAALAIRRSFPDGGGGPVRLLVKPHHVPVEELRAALELVRSRHGSVAALPGLRALLVTDDGRHVAAMRTLVAELDRALDGASLWTIPVEHRPAPALVELLVPLVTEPAAPGKGGGAAGPRLVADPRINVVFVVGSAADHARVAALVRVLDSDQGDDARMTAVRLRHARAAEDMAALQPLLSGGGGAAAAGPGGGASTTGAVQASAGLDHCLWAATAIDREVTSSITAYRSSSARVLATSAGSQWSSTRSASSVSSITVRTRPFGDRIAPQAWSPGARPVTLIVVRPCRKRTRSAPVTSR